MEISHARSSRCKRDVDVRIPGNTVQRASAEPSAEGSAEAVAWHTVSVVSVHDLLTKKPLMAGHVVHCLTAEVILTDLRTRVLVA